MRTSANPTRDDSKQIERALFEAAAAIENATIRRDFLAKACGGDAVLQERIIGLLNAKDAAEKFFHKAEKARVEMAVDAGNEMEVPSGYPKNETEGLGSNVGPYTVLERIGEGGWGIVYLAEQRLPIRRSVALKIIRLGLDTEKVVARFEMERQALALMDHANIARVLDAGATDSGRPYFVMELVHGKRITDHCDEHRLGLEERIELFIQVCHAIQHAHQKGIIHRDIKPSNVLVSSQDGVAVPKVIDFGVVMAIEGRLSNQTSLTGRDQFIGTPAYMSPEQAEGSADLDTRSDIYSLGVLLCELLTGATPFDGGRLAKAGMYKTLRILRDEEPPAPSAMISAMPAESLAVIAKSRSMDPAQLYASIRGDLDSIVLKSLSKDRRMRYGTVNGLSIDLQRFLNEEPVAARPPSRLYLFGKLVRRNKAVFASATAVILALVAGLVVSSWFYLGERQAREMQQRLRESAETAEANANRLLQQAKARRSISNAAILLSGGSAEDADALLVDAPLDSVEPAMEAAAIFLRLGDWNADRNRVQRAAECYKFYLQANRLDRSTVAPSWKIFLTIPPLLVEAGENEAYRQFRQDALVCYGRMVTPAFASNLLRASLLVPADSEFLKRLQGPESLLIETLKKTGSDRTIMSFYPAFMAMSLGLLDYRRGKFEDALKWCRQSMTCADKDRSRVAGVQVIAAMSYDRLGKHAQAKSELESAKKFFADPLLADAVNGREGKGIPHDSRIALVLYREAMELIEPQPVEK